MVKSIGEGAWLQAAGALVAAAALVAASLALAACTREPVDPPLPPPSQAPAKQVPEAAPRPATDLGRLSGRVIDDLADPVVGAEVVAAAAPRRPRLVPRPERGPVRTHTDALGQFRLDPPDTPPGEDLLLTVQHPHFQPWFRRLGPEDPGAGDPGPGDLGPGDLGDLALQPAPGVVVEVRAKESSQPLAGARVRLWPALEDATLPAAVLDMFRREGVTAANGHAPLYAVAQGTHVLRVEAPERATVEIRHEQPATVARALRVAVTLPEGLDLRGRVVAAGTGEPVQGARISCAPEGGRPSHTTSSDIGGEFSLSGLGARSYRLTATHEEHAPLVATVEPGGAPLTLELPAGKTVEGQVLHGVTRRPVAGARVTVRSGTGWPVLRQGSLQQPAAVTDGRGHFRIGGLPGGIVSVAAESEGLFAAEQGPVQPGSGPITLLLRGGSRVTGKAQDPAGQPLRDALVEVLPTQQPGGAPGMPGRQPLPATTTGSSGRFDLAGLPPGRYRLLVQKDGLPPFLSPAFVATPRSSEDLGTLRLPAGGRIRGVATDRSGRPVAGAQVCLDPLSGLPPETAGAQAVCDQEGRFVLGPVAPGHYHMFYYSPGRQTAAQAAASRHDTLVRVQVSDHQDLTRNLHPRSR